MNYSLDYETFGTVDLRKYGAGRYASAPDTEILLAAVSRGDEPPLLWDCFATALDNEPALRLLREMSENPDAVCWSWNAPFEIAVSYYHWEESFGFPPPPLEKWRCSAVLARVAAIPHSLAAACEFLQIVDGKDKAGKALIQIFSIPSAKRGRILPLSEALVTVAGEKVSPAKAWDMFRSYCIQDVVTEQKIHKRLESLELTGWVLEGFLMDSRLNMRGIPINRAGIIKCEKLVSDYNLKLGIRFREITGLNPSQTGKVLEWLKARGYKGSDLRASTMSELMEESDDTEGEPDITEGMTEDAKEALKLRALLSFTATKKLPTLRMAACPEDDRVRGTLLYHGAIRTGRHSAKVCQIQNFRRPTVPNTDSIYHALCFENIDADDLEIGYGPPLECVSSVIRNFIDLGPGKDMLDSDLRQIEARVLAWLSGHDELTQAFREGKDLYKVTAALTWDLEYEQVSKEQRFWGKVISLSCIAEDQLVLTDRGLLPICKVTTCHKVWDGVEWVNHDGVIFKGYREVIEYEGLRATPDHKVFASNGEVLEFGQAKDTGRKLAHTGAGRAPLGTVVPFIDGYKAEKKSQECSRAVPVLWRTRLGGLQQPKKRAYNQMRRLCSSSTQGSSEMADETPFRCEIQVFLSHTSGLGILWGERDRVSFSKSIGCVCMDYGKPWTGTRKANRPYTQRRSLRGGQFKVGYTPGKQHEQENYKNRPSFCFSSGGMALCKNKSDDVFNVGYDTGGNTGKSEKSCSGKEKKLAENREMVLSTQTDTPIPESGRNVQAVSTGGVALYEKSLGTVLFPGFDAGGNNTEGNSNVHKPDRSLRKRSGVAVVERVYDIVNSGPRNRFTVSGILVHNCGYGGGFEALTGMAKIYGAVIEEEKAKEMVKLFRSGNKPIVQHWRNTQAAIVEAIKNPGKWFEVNDKIRYGVTEKLGFRTLVCELPSKRRIHYPYPKVRTVYKVKDYEKDEEKWVTIPDFKAFDSNGNKKDGVWETSEVTYMGPLKASSKWGRCYTHGAKAVENQSQATAGDFLTHGVIEAEKQGFEPICLIHDQVLAEYHPERGNSPEKLTSALCKLPPWAPDFPLDAETNVTPYFTKD